MIAIDLQNLHVAVSPDIGVVAVTAVGAIAILVFRWLSERRRAGASAKKPTGL